MDDKKPMFKIDEALAKQEKDFCGAWVTGPKTGVRFLMRPALYPPYRRMTERLETEYRRKNGMLIGKKSLQRVPFEVTRRCVIQAACEHLIVAWEGVGDHDGNAVAFDPARCFEVAAKIEAFAEDIWDCVGEEEEDSTKEREEIKGN